MLEVWWTQYTNQYVWAFTIRNFLGNATFKYLKTCPISLWNNCCAKTNINEMINLRNSNPQSCLTNISQAIMQVSTHDDIVQYWEMREKTSGMIVFFEGTLQSNWMEPYLPWKLVIKSGIWQTFSMCKSLHFISLREYFVIHLWRSHSIEIM